ncbi:hypothetical protein ACFXGT_20260 [Streptomyces sp. NPDC059352]
MTKTRSPPFAALVGTAASDRPATMIHSVFVFSRSARSGPLAECC